MKLRNIITIGTLAAVSLVGLAACDSAANKASRNLSTAADNFEVPRRITVVNGITGDAVMIVEGYCSLGNNDTQWRMSVTCKTEDGNFIKNFLDKSDNTFVMTEQLASVSVSTFHYRTVFRPQSVIPDIDLQGSSTELLENQNTDG
jgi:hypothetical protein